MKRHLWISWSALDHVRRVLLWVGSTLVVAASPCRAGNVEIPWQGVSTLCYSPRGTLCQILLDSGVVTYRERAAGGSFQEEVVRIDGQPLRGEQPILLFDAGGRPNIVDGQSVSGGPGRVGWYRKSGGRWERASGAKNKSAAAARGTIPLPQPLNRRNAGRVGMHGYLPAPGDLEQPAQFLWSSLAAAFAPDGSLRLLFCDEPAQETWPPANDAVFHLHLGSQTRDGRWRWQVVETFQREWCMYAYYNPPRYFGFVVDRQGVNHAIYCRGFFDDWPAKPRHMRSELRYVSDRSGQWHSEVVSAPLDDSADAGKGGSLVVDDEGNVAVASCYIERAPTGSPTGARLLYHRRQADGQWTRDIIGKGGDGYDTREKGRGTGFHPFMVLDKRNQPHIVFCDFATLHWPKWHCMDYCGQIRHAYHAGGEWKLETLYRQADPLCEQMRYPIVAVTDDELAFGAMKRRVDTNRDGSIMKIVDEYIEGQVPLPRPLMPGTAQR